MFEFLCLVTVMPHLFIYTVRLWELVEIEFGQFRRNDSGTLYPIGKGPEGAITRRQHHAHQIFRNEQDIGHITSTVPWFVCC